MRFQGRIAEWNDDKGFGFVSENGTEKRVFLHIKSLTKRNRRPKVGDLITYEVKIDGKGRNNAERAILNSQIQNLKAEKNDSGLSLPRLHNGFAFAFIVFLVTLTILGKLPIGIPAITIGLSLFTFIVYYSDKYAAVKGAQRTPEITLHLLGLLGGWPGAALAQKSFRHKSSKKSFQINFWITVVLNIGFIFLLLLFPNVFTLHNIFTF
jgi:uncharacterized membrane protein YsdA (DUF1294 family)/cold shock CspA family protein